MVSPAGPTSRADVNATLSSTREALQSAIGGLTSEQMTSPAIDGWSVKDMLAHISAWDELMTSDFRRVKLGAQPLLATFSPDKTDSWNELTVSMRRALPLQQVLAESEATRREMTDSLDALLDAAFESGFVPGILGICARHDEEHSELIDKWRKEVGI